MIGNDILPYVWPATCSDDLYTSYGASLWISGLACQTARYVFRELYDHIVNWHDCPFVGDTSQWIIRVNGEPVRAETRLSYGDWFYMFYVGNKR